MKIEGSERFSMENMDMRAPYLEAIQAISGRTPGEKLKALNEIAMETAKRRRSGEDFTRIISSLNVPEALKSLVRIKVANILKDHEEVIVALKNEDFMVANQARKAKWFYEGTNESIVNFDYFQKNLFPQISRNARTRVIKSLAKYLKNPTVAQRFFSAMSNEYGTDEAMPLLLACDKESVLSFIKEQKPILPCKILTAIYWKYPMVAIDYLKMSYPDHTGSRNISKIDFYDYMDFLPILVKRNANAFVEICEVQLMDLRVGTKRWSSRDSNRQTVWDQCQKKFLHVLSMKLIAEKLSKDQFQGLFTKSCMEFAYLFECEKLLEYLKHFKDGEKLSFLLKAYEENFGESLLNSSDKITSDLLGMMPAEERAKQARLKLKENDYWLMGDEERSLRCYLTTSESIPAIKKKISKTSDPSDRCQLLRQLVFTCQVNDDREALLDVLRYFMEKHSNETQKVRYGFLERVLISFDLSTLSAEHLAILKNCIDRSHERNEFSEVNAKVIRIALQKLAECNRSNDLPIDKEIDRIIDLGMNGWLDEWRVTTESPEFEREYLCAILNGIAKKYQDRREAWENNRAKVVEGLIRYIYEFDARNRKAKNSIDRISIKDYPWLLDECKALLRSRNDETDNDVKKKMMKLLRTNEKDLYDVWLKEIMSISDYTMEDILDVLSKAPQKVSDDWKEYLRNAQNSMPSRKAKLFIRRTRWYHGIPMKFAGQCLAEVKDAEKKNTLITLALLVDADLFVKVTEPFAPSGSEADTSSETPQEIYRIMKTIPECMNEVSPPVSLDSLSRFCIGDAIKPVMHFLSSTSLRVAVPKVMSFAKSVREENVPLKNHAIQLVSKVSSLRDEREFLTDLWKTVKSRSIRKVILSRVHDLFGRNPNRCTWRMMEECTVGLAVDDERRLLDRITRLDSIPNEYISRYVQLAFHQISTLERNGCDPVQCTDMRCALLKNINSTTSPFLPENYCEELLRRYLFAFDQDPELTEAGMDFAINSYVRTAGEKLEMRLNVIAERFASCVKKYWDVPHPKDSTMHPMNAMVVDFVKQITLRDHREHDILVYEKLLETLVSVLPPEQDPSSYLLLIFSIENKKADSTKDFGMRVGRRIPKIIETLSPESVKYLANKLREFICSLEKEGEYSPEISFGIIEGLIEVGTYHTLMIAACMAYNVYLPEANEKFNAIVAELHKRKHAGLTSILYEYRNCCTK